MNERSFPRHVVEKKRLCSKTIYQITKSYFLFFIAYIAFGEIYFQLVIVHVNDLQSNIIIDRANCSCSKRLLACVRFTDVWNRSFRVRKQKTVVFKRVSVFF